MILTIKKWRKVWPSTTLWGFSWRNWTNIWLQHAEDSLFIDLTMSRSKVEKSTKKGSLGYLQKRVNSRVYLRVKTCEVFLCFVAIVRVRAIVLTSLFSLFYVTGECHRFLHRGWAEFYFKTGKSADVFLSLYLIFVSLSTAISGKLTIIVKYSTFRPFSIKKYWVRKAYLLLLSYM